MPRLPGINHQDAVRAFEKAGFRVIRQGKHVVMSNGERLITIPRHHPIKAFTMGGIIRDAGLSIEEFRTWESKVAPRSALGCKGLSLSPVFGHKWDQSDSGKGEPACL